MDDEGFITLTTGVSTGRFFPLGTFFYPALPPDGALLGPAADYAAFAGLGGNLVVAPWHLADWPNRPGAIFKDQGTCGAHLNAAHDAGVKILADPTLFWGTAGTWNGSGAEVTQGNRATMFSTMVTSVEASYGEDAFMGYYHWDQPAWRYYNSGSPPTTPTPSYVTASAADTKTLESGVGADHAILTVQSDAVKVQDLWRDYYDNDACDISGGIVLPFPEPSTLQTQNETALDPKYKCLLPNYYSSVTGSLADAVHESALANPPGQGQDPRCKPYLAVLQGKNTGLSALTYAEMRFQAYDAIIHGAKGLIWYDDHGFQGLSSDKFYEDVAEPLADLLGELSSAEFMGFLSGDYDHLLVLVDSIEPQDVIAESTSLIGGHLMPKTHFLSDQVIIESVAKKYNGYTYLIAARRPNVDPLTDYNVRFRPCFSVHHHWNPWEGTNESGYIDKYTGNGTWVQIPVEHQNGEGFWVEEFSPGEVNIYRFIPPPPYQP
jgi:hypothetical protein